MRARTVQGILALVLAGAGSFTVSYAVSGISPVSSNTPIVDSNDNPLRIKVQNVDADPSQEPTPEPTNAPTPDPTQEPSPEPTQSPTVAPTTNSPTPFGTGAPRKPPVRQSAYPTTPSPAPSPIILTE